MAVYEHRYRPYAGPQSALRLRWLVIPRYVLAAELRSKLWLAFLVACAVWPVLSAIIIYLHFNAGAIKLLEMSVNDLIPIDAGFFFTFLRIQTGLGFLAVLFLGSALLPADLRHNALPLYLSRPLTRFEYLAGKFAVLAVLLSLISWVPALVLFTLQAVLTGNGWGAAHLQIAAGTFVSSWVWITVLTLLTLAISSITRRAPVTGIAVAAIILVLRGMAATINALYNTSLGNLLSPATLIDQVTGQLIGVQETHSSLLSRFETPIPPPLPLWAAWLALAVLVAICAAILALKVKAYEVAT